MGHDLNTLRLYNSLNNAASAVHMLTAADQVLVIARHGEAITISAEKEATTEHLTEIEMFLVKTLNHVRELRREVKKKTPMYFANQMRI